MLQKERHGQIGAELAPVVTKIQLQSFDPDRAAAAAAMASAAAVEPAGGAVSPRGRRAGQGPGRDHGSRRGEERREEHGDATVIPSASKADDDDRAWLAAGAQLRRRLKPQRGKCLAAGRRRSWLAPATAVAKPMS